MLFMCDRTVLAVMHRIPAISSFDFPCATRSATHTSRRERPNCNNLSPRSSSPVGTSSGTVSREASPAPSGTSLGASPERPFLKKRPEKKRIPMPRRPDVNTMERPSAAARKPIAEASAVPMSSDPVTTVCPVATSGSAWSRPAVAPSRRISAKMKEPKIPAPDWRHAIGKNGCLEPTAARERKPIARSASAQR